MTTTRTRSRTLAVGSDASRDGLISKIKEYAQSFYLDNQDKNAKDRSAKKHRVDLLASMGELRRKTLHLEAEGNVPALDIAVTTPETEAIDPLLMRDLVTDEQFMQMVSISKSAAANIVGQDVIARSVRKSVGTTNVSVKPAK